MDSEMGVRDVQGALGIVQHNCSIGRVFYSLYAKLCVYHTSIITLLRLHIPSYHSPCHASTAKIEIGTTIRSRASIANGATSLRNDSKSYVNFPHSIVERNAPQPTSSTGNEEVGRFPRGGLLAHTSYAAKRILGPSALVDRQAPTSTEWYYGSQTDQGQNHQKKPSLHNDPNWYTSAA